MCLHLRPAAVRRVASGGGNNLRAGRGRSADGAEQCAPGRYSAARRERRVRRELRAAVQDRRPVDHGADGGTRQRAAAGRNSRAAGTRAAAGAASVAQCFGGASHRPRGASLAAAVSRFPRHPGRDGRHHSARRRRQRSELARPGASPLRPQPSVCARRPLRRPEARHRAERGRRHHPRLARRRVQGHRTGHTGNRRAGTAADLPVREQLPRSGGRERAVRRRRPGHPESGRRWHHVPPQLLFAPDVLAQPVGPDALGRVGRGGAGRFAAGRHLCLQGRGAARTAKRGRPLDRVDRSECHDCRRRGRAHSVAGSTPDHRIRGLRANPRSADDLLGRERHRDSSTLERRAPRGRHRRPPALSGR